PIDRVIQEPAVTELAEFNQQNHRDRSVGGAKIGNRLGRAVFNDAEVLFLEAIQVVAIVIRNNNIDVHDRHGYRDSKSGLARLLLVLSLGGCLLGRRRLGWGSGSLLRSLASCKGRRRPKSQNGDEGVG